MMPDRRRHNSNAYMPEEHWHDWDERRKSDPDYHPSNPNASLGPPKYPAEWQRVIRPITAKLFREGVLEPLYGDGAVGLCIAATEPSRPKLDLYLDYRHQPPNSPPGPEHQDPNVPASFLLSSASSFAKTHPDARFALLRIWSAPHFWPVMMSSRTREEWSFYDGKERVWAFKFLPKDAPRAEWMVHDVLRQRIAPYWERFQENVLHKRDMLLVMGEDEEHLQRLCEALTFAVQTRPWRLEVDLWKSFVNVEVEFLVGLDRRWLD